MFLCFGHSELDMAFRHPGGEARLAVGEGWLRVT